MPDQNSDRVASCCGGAPAVDGQDLAKHRGAAWKINLPVPSSAVNNTQQYEAHFAWLNCYCAIATRPQWIKAAVFEAPCTDYSLQASSRLPAAGSSIGRAIGWLAHRARRHDFLHHGDEPFPIRFAQIGHRLKMSAARCPFHLAKQRGARFREPAALCPAIVIVNGTLDKMTQLQALERTCRGGAVKRDIRGQGRLVGSSAFRERGEKTILQRRDFKNRAFLLEQRDMDLMQPPYQEARTLLERP